jgi:hypothetical protein
MPMCRLLLVLVISVSTCLWFSGCTVKVSDYTSAEEDNASPWIDVYGDTMKDFSIYITYSDGKAVASISGYAHPDSMNFLQDVSVSISEFSNQDVPLLVCYGSFPGTTNAYIESFSYTSVADSVSAACGSLDGDQVDFQITRTYEVDVNNLPERLTLAYDVHTKYGNKTGTHVFKLYEREVEQNIRIH